MRARSHFSKVQWNFYLRTLHLFGNHSADCLLVLKFNARSWLLLSLKSFMKLGAKYLQACLSWYTLWIKAYCRFHLVTDCAYIHSIAFSVMATIGGKAFLRMSGRSLHYRFYRCYAKLVVQMEMYVNLDCRGGAEAQCLSICLACRRFQVRSPSSPDKSPR